MELLTGRDDGMNGRLLHLPNPLQLLCLAQTLHLPTLLFHLTCLLPVNISDVVVRRVVSRVVSRVVARDVFCVLEVVTTLAGDGLSPSLQLTVYRVSCQNSPISLECQGQHVFLSSVSLQFFLFLSVLKTDLVFNFLVLFLTGIFPLLIEIFKFQVPPVE